MRYVVCDRVGLSRLPEGPLASYIVSFANSMRWTPKDIACSHSGIRCALLLALASGSHDQEWNCIAYAPNTRRSICDIELDVCGLAGGTALHFDISSSFCTTVASFVLNAQTRAAGRRLNSMPRRTDSTYARCVVWPKQRLRITRRSPQISCKTASATGESICHVCVRAMSLDLYSLRPNVCI
jgi:hypothetical protein